MKKLKIEETMRKGEFEIESNLHEMKGHCRILEDKVPAVKKAAATHCEASSSQESKGGAMFERSWFTMLEEHLDSVIAVSSR